MSLTVESVNPRPLGAEASKGVEPIASPLASILGDKDDKWAEGQADRDLHKFNVEWSAAEQGFSIQSNFSQKRVKAKGRPYNTAMQEQAGHVFTLSPFAGMNFTANKQRTETMDFGMVSLGLTEIEAMGLTQSYGGGDTAGSLAFKRKVTERFKPEEDEAFSPLALIETTEERELKFTQGFGMFGDASKLEYVRGLTTVQKPNQYAKEQATDAVRLNTSLWAQTNFAGVYERSHASEMEGLHNQHRGLTLARKFASGDAAVSYDNVAKRLTGVTTETTTQSLKVPFRIDGTVLSAAFDSKTVQRNSDVTSDARKASFATKLAGNDVTGSWDRNTVKKNGKDNKTTKTAFALPFDFFGEKATFNFKSDGTQVDGKINKKSRDANLMLPLSHFRDGASLSYVVAGLHEPGKKPKQEVRTAKLLMPLSLFGKPVATEHERITTRAPDGKTMRFSSKATAPFNMLGRNVQVEGQYIATNKPTGAEQDQVRTKLVVPFKPGPVVVQRQSITDTTPQGEEKHTRIVQITGPRVPLSPMASVQADMEQKDLPSGAEHRITHFNVQAKPASKLTLAADYRKRDLGPANDTTEHQFDATYAVSERLSLNARYLDREQLDKSPFIRRTWVVQHKNATPSGLRLRAGVTSTDDGKVDGEHLKLVEIGFGDPKKLGFTAKYQKYNEEKLTSLGDPTIHFALQRGTPDSLHWVLGYEDQKGRCQPYRRYGIGFPLGSSSLDLAYSQNAMDPTDPKKKRIRVADIYDAALSSKILGDVGLSLSYRYCEYPEHVQVDEQTDQWLQVKLSGGKVESGGAIQLAYASGDFVKLAEKPERTPTSILSLQYEKRWDDDGALSLKIDRTTVPESIKDLQDSYEGRLQFEHRF